MSQGQTNAEGNNQQNTTNMSNGPSKCEITYMKLVADVYKDIDKLSNTSSFTDDNNKSPAVFLFNNSSAVRKLVVFLAIESLGRIGNSMAMDIGENEQKLNTKEYNLLLAALKPSFGVRLFLIHNKDSVNIIPTEKSMNVGFDKDYNTVYYDSGKFSEIEKNNDYDNIMRDVVTTLSKMVEAIKTVNKDENKENSFKSQSGEVKDLIDLDDKTKQNITKILTGYSGQTLGQKLAKLWNAFLNFFGLGEKVTAQNKIIPEKKEKQAVHVLSNLLANANKHNVNRTENQNTK